MEERSRKIEVIKKADQSEFLSKVVRAGKRTYFFDVKKTQNEDFYLTITESKKQQSTDGTAFYEKHRIFLYTDDFESFADGISEMMKYIRSMPDVKADRTDNIPPTSVEEFHKDYSALEEDSNADYSIISFENLEVNR